MNRSLQAVGLVGRSDLRRRLGALAALALAVTLGLGAALGAFIAAYRTDRAYPDHVVDARVADLLVNPSLATARSDAVIRGLPHVRAVATSDLLLAGVWDGRPHTVGDVLAGTDQGEVHGSADTRYTATDRLIVDEGRRPTGHREIFVTESYRPALARTVGHPVAVGDRIPVAFLWSGLDVGPTPDTIDDPVHPIGVEQLRITGFGRLADEVIDDPLFPRQELIVSPDVVRRYSCTTTLPTAGDRAALLHAVLPDTCSLSYRYWALRIDDPKHVPAVERTAQHRLTALNAEIPKVLQAIPDGPAYYPVVTTRRENEAAVRHSVRPSVVALRIFGVMAAVATLVVVLLAAARIIRGGRATDEILRALGMRRGARTLALALPSLLGAAVGTVGAVVVGILLSPIGPVGDVVRVSPHRTFAAPAAPIALTTIGCLVVLAVAIIVAALIAARPHRDGARPPGGQTARRLLGGLRPEIADGIATGLGRGRAAFLPVAAAVAIGAVVAASVFGANVAALVSEPHRYGWPWQIGVLSGYGYGDTDRALVRATLEHRAEVRSWDEVGFASGTVEGAPVAVLFGAEPIDLAVVQGRLPRRVGEVVLGRDTAARLGIRIGDRTRLVIRGGPQRVRVVGTTVMPSVGQYQSDRAGLGIGVFALVPSKRMDDHAVTFVGIHLRSGANAGRTLTAIRSRVARWDETGTPPYTYTTVRPAEIVNADAIRGAPTVLAGVLAVALLVALVLSLGATVNARRRDIAVYRALGFTDGQVATSVRWHTLAAVGVGLVVGIPTGVVGGRWLWRRFAEQLGVGPAPTVPGTLLLIIAFGAVIGALVAAQLPARRAVRLRPAELLHVA